MSYFSNHTYAKFVCCLVFCAAFFLYAVAQAAPPPTNLPGPADASRVRNWSVETGIEKGRDDEVMIPEASSLAEIPPTAKDIHFVLNDVVIKGSTVYSNEQLSKIYAPYIGKDVTLDVAWTITNRITLLYRSDGYFLSRAYIPAQNVKEGVITIKVVEGYIGEVVTEGDTNYISRLMADEIKQKNPIKAIEIESFLLRLNDLPGLSYRAILSKLGGASADEEGAVKILLVSADKQGAGTISFDNYGSRFLGPHEALASYSTSIIPLQQTSISFMSSIPSDELKNGVIDHQIAIWPEFTLDLNASDTQAYPGYSLEEFEVASNSKSLAASLTYSPIRQRDVNLLLKTILDLRNSESTVLGTRLTHDHVRVLRLEASGNISDDWGGYNIFKFTASKGIDGLGSSRQGDLNLSREGAKPDFSKIDFILTRQQRITDDFAVQFSLTGQYSPDVLFSSEEFGYGGQVFGRAFDSSEITGNSGFNQSIELRYGHYSALEPMGFTPYVFIDNGSAWNDAAGQPEYQTGRSVGLGLRITGPSQISCNLGVALPLVRNTQTPLYGQNNSNPRILLELSKQF